jgi:plasmid stabilization system protein ParE
MKYRAVMSDDAQNDYDEYIDYILNDCCAPITAAKHYAGIKDIISWLSENPYVNAIRYNTSLLKYGMNVRRANYKKISIVYTVHENFIYIHRILAASMITEI